jgi:hypothetical protein
LTDTLTPEEFSEALVRSDLKPDEQVAALLDWCKDGGRAHVQECATTYMNTRRRLYREGLQR